MTARPAGHSERLRARESGTGSGSGASIERLPLAAVLDDIRSLWNVGSIFRTADGCGLRKLWLAGITGTPPRAEITKTALGAEEQVAWDYRADVVEAIEQARSEGYEPVCVESGEASASLDDFRWPERPCLVLGNEATGVSPLVLEACERRVSIPMCGVKGSFNVAVAFGIAAHRAARALAPDHPGVVFRG
jgi:tRNA G18 (ribose-2'-O)-methylase SpoU